MIREFIYFGSQKFSIMYNDKILF